MGDKPLCIRLCFSNTPKYFRAKERGENPAFPTSILRSRKWKMENGKWKSASHGKKGACGSGKALRVCKAPAGKGVRCFTHACTRSFYFLLQQCHTSCNLLKHNALRCGIEVALVATNSEFNGILTLNRHKINIKKR